MKCILLAALAQATSEEKSLWTQKRIKNSAVVEAESAKMLARERQGKVDGLQAVEESLKTTEAKAEAVEARAAPTEKADCDEQLA